jgi:hypothetical protein
MFGKEDKSPYPAVVCYPLTLKLSKHTSIGRDSVLKSFRDNNETTTTTRQVRQQADPTGVAATHQQPNKQPNKHSSFPNPDTPFQPTQPKQHD